MMRRQGRDLTLDEQHASAERTIRHLFHIIVNR